METHDLDELYQFIINDNEKKKKKKKIKDDFLLKMIQLRISKKLL